MRPSCWLNELLKVLYHLQKFAPLPFKNLFYLIMMMMGNELDNREGGRADKIKSHPKNKISNTCCSLSMKHPLFLWMGRGGPILCCDLTNFAQFITFSCHLNLNSWPLQCIANFIQFKFFEMQLNAYGNFVKFTIKNNDLFIVDLSLM